jgi:AraC family transcriptional regulator of adaptative response/methylated-DNA-[protein]-cysteine methyltransferase
MISKAISTPTPTEQDPRWTHVKMRDKSADGAFWYSVETTGVFLRPACA